MFEKCRATLKGKRVECTVEVTYGTQNLKLQPTRSGILHGMQFIFNTGG